MASSIKTNGFLWLKTTPNAEVIKLDGKGLHYGNSLSGTCANTEPVLLGDSRLTSAAFEGRSSGHHRAGPRAQCQAGRSLSADGTALRRSTA